MLYNPIPEKTQSTLPQCTMKPIEYTMQLFLHVTSNIYIGMPKGTGAVT